VRDILDGRGSKKTRGVKGNFAFSGLVTCGHCGCAHVGEIKKGRRVYYHCTGYKGKCPEKYTREKVLEEQFGKIIKAISLPADVVALVSRALRESHADQRRFREAAIAKVEAEDKRIRNRLDTMYMDRLDERISVEDYDRRAAALKAEQAQIPREMQAHRLANESYIEEGVTLLDLARRAHELFESQPAKEKRRRLDSVLSNCTWRQGELSANYRQPFNLLANAGAMAAGKNTGTGAVSGQNENWLPRKRGFQRVSGWRLMAIPVGRVCKQIDRVNWTELAAVRFDSR
jgi:hypothetical protein